MMKNFNRFTIKAQEALQNAQDLASGRNHGEFKALHLLAALIDDDQSLIQPLLVRVGIDLGKLDQAIEEELKKLPKIFTNAAIGQLYLSQELMQVLDKAAKVAQHQKDEYISCEHLLLGILETASAAQILLDRAGFKREAALRILAQLRGSMRVT